MQFEPRASHHVGQLVICAVRTGAGGKSVACPWRVRALAKGLLASKRLLKWSVGLWRVQSLRGEYCFVEGENGLRRDVVGFRSQEEFIQITKVFPPPPHPHHPNRMILRASCVYHIS